MRTCVLVALAVGAVLARGDEDPVRREYARFKGTWKFVSMEMDGKKLEEQLKEARMTLDGDRFTVVAGGVTFRGQFKVDPAKKPRQIDVFYEEGPEKGKTSRGIYELEGDTYKVCIGLVGKERPTEFVTRPGSGHVLQVLERVKDRRDKK
jgi:uncharacterized protein (TIGR03067 family)